MKKNTVLLLLSLSLATMNTTAQVLVTYPAPQGVIYTSPGPVLRKPLPLW